MSESDPKSQDQEPQTNTAIGKIKAEQVAHTITATANVSASATIIANAQVIRGQNSPGPRRDSLIGNVVRRSTTKSFVLAGTAAVIGLISLVVLGISSVIPWVLVGCATWRGLDATLTLRRLAKGQYGDADYELREIVGPLVARIKKGGDPDDPDRLFPERPTEHPVLATHPGQVTA